MSDPAPEPLPQPERAPEAVPPEIPPWRAKLEENALWVALALVAIAGLVVAIGIQVAPETFYDRFWWEDIYGPLVVDAHQCRTAATCPGLSGPPGIVVKDGYTVTSELTYGLVLAVMLYGIYVGLFRRFGLVADGRFVLALLPWILIGPVARVLEDSDVFCAPGTHCTPNAWAPFFISPVIYVHIAVYVIAAMLIGVFLHRQRHKDPRLVAGVFGGVLAAGLLTYAFVSWEYGHTFQAMPPLWFIALVCAASFALFWSRAKERQVSVNLTVFAFGIPFAAGCLYLVGRWLFGYDGGIWVDAARDEPLYPKAGLFIAAAAVLVASGIYLLARWLARSGAERSWARSAVRVSSKLPERLGWAGAVCLGLFLLLSGSLGGLSDRFSGFPQQHVLAPLLGIAGVALLGAFAYLHVGQDLEKRPGALLVYTAGINVALVLGHMIDGIATWVALEGTSLFGLPTYSEKHPFSDFLLQFGEGPMAGLAFPAVKLLMVLVVVWVLDRETKSTTSLGPEHEKNLVGLVKMAIFVLGFAPGLRDLLRISMGV